LNYIKNNQKNNGNPMLLSNKNPVFVKHSKNNSISTSLYKIPKNFENNIISHDINNKNFKNNHIKKNEEIIINFNNI
jgi:hypothetical protein